MLYMFITHVSLIPLACNGLSSYMLLSPCNFLLNEFFHHDPVFLLRRMTASMIGAEESGIEPEERCKFFVNSTRTWSMPID